MKSRMTILGEAERLAHEVLDGSIVLSDETLENFRKKDLSDDSIIHQLVQDFLQDAIDHVDFYFDEVLDNEDETAGSEID